MIAPGHAMIVLTGGFLEVGKTERGGSHPLVVLLFCTQRKCKFHGFRY